MELTGEHRIPAPRQRVWEALHDPEILKECITGCESLEMEDDGTMKARVTAKVGPVKATFNADVEIQNSNPPQSYTLTGEGKGGVAGFAKGSADVALAEEGEETILTYNAKANVGGKLAQLGSRLVDSTAKRYAADFFTKFSERVGGAPPADTAAPEAAPEPAPAPTAVPESGPASAMEAAAPAPEPIEPTPPPAPIPPAPATAAAAPMPGPVAATPTVGAGGGGNMWLWIAAGVVVLAVILIAAS